MEPDMAMCGTKKMKAGGKAKTPSSATRRGHGAYGRELSKQRQLDDAIMRFQGEDLEAGRAAGMKAGGKVKKMAMGGKVRGGGAATKGLQFRKNG
jgi:hypothetical protein